MCLLRASQEYTVTGVQGDYLPTFFAELVELIDLTRAGEAGADNLVFPLLAALGGHGARVLFPAMKAPTNIKATKPILTRRCSLIRNSLLCPWY